MLKTVLAFARRVPLRYYLIVAAFAAVAGYVAMLKMRLGNAEDAAIANERKAANALADAAVTRTLINGAMFRLAHQRQILADTTAELARFRDIVARADVGVTIDSGTVAGDAMTMIDSADVRVVEIDTYSAPFRLVGVVASPPPPLRARYRFRIGLDSIPIRAQIGCYVEDGIGLAGLTLESPAPWAHLTVDSVTVGPMVCPTVFQRSTSGRGSVIGGIARFLVPPLVGGITGAVTNDWRVGVGIGTAATIAVTVVF